MILIPDINNFGRMQAVSNLEVVGSIPIVAHQLMSSPRHQENLNLQSFPPRSTMLDHRISNASSTASDFKFDKHALTPPPDALRPLSPRKTNLQTILQNRINRSLTERRN
jgi:hypothetical protein